MNRKSNSFKNIITVLLALLLLGIAAGPTSAALPLDIIATEGITGQVAGGNITLGDISGNAVFNVTIFENEITDLPNGTHYINITVPSDITIDNSTMAASEDLLTDASDISTVETPTYDETTRNVTVQFEIVNIIAIDDLYISFNVTTASNATPGAKTFITYLDGVDEDVVDNTTVEINGSVPVLTTITVENATVVVGNNATFTPTTLDQYNASINATVTWNSSNTSVGTIDNNTGVFLALAIGTSTITATSGNITGIATATVTTVVPVLTNITVSPATISVAAGATTTFTATTLDQENAPIDAPVTWNSSNISVGTIDNSTGVFTAIGAGSSTITATSGNITGIATATVTTVVPVEEQLVINSITYGNLTNMNGVAVTPTSMVAGVATLFKINALDVNGDLNTSFTGTMTISVNGSGTATPSSYQFVSADNGTKNISITDNVAETILINFNSTSVTTNATTTVTVVPNRPSKMLFNSSMPLSTLTNSLQVNISVADAYNNLINASKLTGGNYPTNATQLGGTDGLGLGIEFNLSLGLPIPGSSALDTTSVVIRDITVNNYVAYVNDTVDQTVRLRATASFFSPESIYTNLSFLAPVSDILVSTNKTNNTAHANTGANSLGSINITAQLRDASGNTLSVPGSVITFSSDNTTVLNVAAQTATTNANGQAIITVSTTYVAGTAVIIASDSSGHEGTVTVTTTPVVSNASSTLTVASATSRAGDNVTVSATIKDYAGTIVPAGTTVSFNITSGDSTSTLNSVAKSTIVTADTNSTGVATVTFRSTNGSEVVNTINATIVDELSVIRQIGSLPTITVSPNDAAVLVVSPVNKGFSNIKGQNATFTVTTYDNYGNLNTSIGSLKVNVSTTDMALGNMTPEGGSAINNYAVITTASGNGTMVYMVNSTTAGSATLTFAAYTNESSQVSGLVNNITKTVHVTTSGASLVTITPSATGAAVNTNIILTVNLTDADGNLIGIDGTAMSLITSGGSLSPSSLESTGGQGLVNVTSSTAGDVTITVYVAGLTSATTTVTFSGNATTFTLTPTSPSVAVNGTTNITIQAYDTLGNRATIFNGADISSETGVIPGVSGLTFSATSFTFNATGNAIVNVTSATAGTYTIQAVALDLVKTTNVTFTPSTTPVLSVIASPTNVTVGTETNVTFTVTPALSGVLVTLSGAGVSVNGTTTNGTVTIPDVNATSAGTITAIASKTGYTSGTATVTASGPVAGTLSVIASPTTVTVGTPVNVTFTVTPALSGVLVTLSGAGVSMNGTTTNGTVTIPGVNATSAATIAVIASMTGYTNGHTDVTASGPVAGTLSIIASPTTVTVGSAATVTFTVTPALSGVLVTLSGAGVSVNGTTTNGAVIIPGVNATSAGTITATASMTGYTSGTANVTASGPVVGTLNVIASPTAVIIGAGTTVTFTVTSNGTNVSGATVTLSGNITTVSGTTDVNGRVVISVNATGTGAITATAAKTGYTSGTATVAARSNVLPPEVAAWDANNDGRISKPEAISAVVAYFNGTITKANAIAVVVAYFGA